MARKTSMNNTVLPKPSTIKDTGQDIRKIILDIARTEEWKSFFDGGQKCDENRHRDSSGFAHWMLEIDTSNCRCKEKPTMQMTVCKDCLAAVHGTNTVICPCGNEHPNAEVLFRGQVAAR